MPQSTADPVSIADYRRRLTEALLDRHPDRVVLVGPGARVLADESSWLCDAGGGSLKIQSFATIDSVAADGCDGDADPGAICVVLMSLAAGDALERTLGEACLAFPEHLLIEHVEPVAPIEPGDKGKTDTVESPTDKPACSPHRFFAFGFRRLFKYSGEDGRRAVYEFRLSDYKQPPDWLNTRYWAHPERFDPVG